MSVSFSAQSPLRRRHTARYRHIALVLVKYQLGDLIRTLNLDRFLPFHFVPPVLPWTRSDVSRAARTRMAMEDLGTTFVKLGQILSTRVDLLPPDYTAELSKLQNALKPLPTDVIKQAILEELGKPVEEIFATFDPVPMGVASIGQAHAATLRDGAEVVVKVRKPGVVEQAEEDMDILHQLAEAASRNWRGIPQQYDLVAIVHEIAETFLAEMDYVREGHSAEHFSRFFAEDDGVHVPKIYWDYTRPRVITLERIHGFGILDTIALEKAGFNRKEIAEHAVGLWLKMIFTGSLMHADPHPGNLFVEGGGRLGLIDYGMVYIIDEEVRQNLASALRAIVARDVDSLVDSLMELGAFRHEVSRDMLRGDLKHVMGHYPSLSTADLHLGANLGELFTVVRRNHIQLPANTFLLLKTVAMAQSLGKALDPQFDILPMLESYVRQTLDVRHATEALVKGFRGAVADMALFGLSLPRRLNRFVKSVERGELQIKPDMTGLEDHMRHLERLVNRMIFGILIAAIILCLTVLYVAFRLPR